jgi:hypothetical protein
VRLLNVLSKITQPLAAVLLALPLKAQVYYGDTSFVSEGRKETRGWFRVDTGSYIGHRKVDDRYPWVYEIKPPLQYQDWWFETSSCQVLRTSFGQFRMWRYFVVNSENFGARTPFQIGYLGYTLVDSMAIYIAAAQRDDKIVVTHEMSHALQHLNGWRINHSFRFFGPLGCGFSYVDGSNADPELRR